MNFIVRFYPLFAKRYTLYLVFNAIIIVFLLASTIGCQNNRLYKESQVMMGTFVEVISPSREAAPIVFFEIKRIEHLLSKYDPESEISRLNQAKELKVSPETFFILSKAKEFFTLTNGAFDITVGPLVSLWGFTEKKFRIPEDSEIREAINAIGTDKIILNNDNYVVKLLNSTLCIDLGGIAKGYAVDIAVKRLKEEGIASCLINAGGQIYCLGANNGRPWRIAIKSPDGKGFLGSLELSDKAVSTSGDYEQFFFRDKKRYGHIINPKTGFPADSGISSVTVIACDGLTADALSTSIFVLGRKEGEGLLKKFPGAKAKIVEKNVQDN